jgi:hypothetical protein
MAGKGFTVKKDWDNPREHQMPAGTRVPAEVRLGTVVVAPATVLAPMAGITDTVFRRFIRHASLFSAEFDPSQVPESRPEAPPADSATSDENASGAKAPGQVAEPMYGLKPVPFTLEPVRLRPIPFASGPFARSR